MKRVLSHAFAGNDTNLYSILYVDNNVAPV